jgi:hypothetical protein
MPTAWFTLPTVGHVNGHETMEGPSSMNMVVVSALKGTDPFREPVLSPILPHEKKESCS